MKKHFHIQYIGYWSERYENGVTPAFLCGVIDKASRDKIVAYLKNGIRGTEFLGYARCRFECELSNTKALGNTDMTDGQWMWPEGLSHYVEKHNLLLPPEFLKYLKRNNYQLPPIDSDFAKSFTGEGYPQQIETSGDDKVWVNWLKEKGEDEYLLNPIQAKKVTRHPPEHDVFDDFFKVQKEKDDR